MTNQSQIITCSNCLQEKPKFSGRLCQACYKRPDRDITPRSEPMSAAERVAAYKQRKLDAGEIPYSPKFMIPVDDAERYRNAIRNAGESAIAELEAG